MSNVMKVELLWKAEAKSFFNKSQSSFCIINTIKYPHRTSRWNEWYQVPLRLLKILRNLKDFILQSLRKTILLCTLASAVKYTSPRKSACKIYDGIICNMILDSITHITFSSCMLFYSTDLWSWRGNRSMEIK